MPDMLRAGRDRRRVFGDAIAEPAGAATRLPSPFTTQEVADFRDLGKGEKREGREGEGWEG